MIERVIYRGRIYTRDPDSKHSSRRRYFTRKTGKTTTHKSQRFYLHRVIYEDNIGPIPADCVIHHKDGNPLNNEASNLVAIPEYLHARTFHRMRARMKMVS
jgi:hypothetical protein